MLGGAEDIPDIIDTLNKNNIKATFFVVGDWVKKNPEAVKKLNDANMEIANHSYNHASVSKMSYEQNLEDMKKCNELITEITGKPVKYYRGPSGEYSNAVIQAAQTHNMQVIQWNSDSLDYKGLTPDEMWSRIQKKLRNGSIILMHNDTKYTATGLQQIIDNIHNEGYEFVSLDELIYTENYEINHEGRQIKK